MTKMVRLDDISKIDVSNVDKKIKDGQKQIRLCNFVDVYYNWAITKDLHDEMMVATASNEQIERFILKKGQVAITKDSETRDDIGISSYIADDFSDTILGYHTVLITPDESVVNGKYLNVFLNSQTARKYFENQASGSGQRYTLTQEAIGSILIPIIPMKVQMKIGEIFSYIDRKISNNNKINIELENMSKTIFDYWFLQFNFPNEEGKAYKLNGGKMVWNEELKSEIPEGWKYMALGDFTDIKAGGDKNSNTQDEYDDEHKIPVYANGSDHKGLYGYTDKATVSEPCITVAARGTVGLSFLRLEPFMPIIRLICIIPKQVEYVKFLEIALNNIRYRKNGSIQQQLTIPQISDYRFVIPPLDIMKLFNEYAMEWQRKIMLNEKENEELLSLRKFLIPLLINGQVKFKGCEKDEKCF